MDTLLSSRRRRLLGAAGALGALAMVGCSESRRADGTSARSPHLVGQTMGTGYNLRIAGITLSSTRLENLHADVQSALDGIDRGMSMYQPTSELSLLNRHAAESPLALSERLFTVLQDARVVSELSQGAFDVTVAPLVLAWGFGPEPRQGIPSTARLQAGRTALDYRRLELRSAERQVVKHLPGMQVDLSAIAKGYGVDVGAAVLRAQGIENFMLEVGGEVVTAGRNAQGQAWQIGIEEPDAVPQRARMVVPLSGKAMATSGDYRIFFEEQGRRYCHEIDPAAGEPIRNGLASVTTVADNCMRADALATALIVMGLERAQELVEREHIAAHFIVRTADGSLRDHSSAAFAELRGTQAAA